MFRLFWHRPLQILSPSSPQSDFLVYLVYLCPFINYKLWLNLPPLSLDTTALSIALGNQGQKLPLVRRHQVQSVGSPLTTQQRNRHGSTATPKRRRKNNESESEDDSE